MSADNTAKKLSGLATLRPLIADKETKWHAQIIPGLISALAVEKDASVREPIVSMLRTLDQSVLEQKTLDDALAQLIEASRTQVIIGDLHRSRVAAQHDGQDVQYHAPNPDSVEAIAKAIGTAIVGLLRLGAKTKDFSAVYCAASDFSGLELSHAKFSNAILFSANFNESILVGADFDSADIESATFVSADLRDALLTQGTEDYVGRLFGRFTGDTEIHLPVFDCADLRNASFDRHPLFGFSPDIPLPNGRWVRRLGPIYGGTFHRANIEGTKFERARIFAFLTRPGQRPAGFFETVVVGTDMASIAKASLPSPLSPGRSKSSFISLRDSFNGTNWEGAIFSPLVREWLEADPPKSLADGSPSKRCRARVQ